MYHQDGSSRGTPNRLTNPVTATTSSADNWTPGKKFLVYVNNISLIFLLDLFQPYASSQEPRPGPSNTGTAGKKFIQVYVDDMLLNLFLREIPLGI